MNIHIDDENRFELLRKATLFKAIIGSHMYGTSNEHSDQDILHIYALSKMEEKSFVKTHHQYQYKKDGIDYLFVNIDAFLRNSLSGDSTINFEVIHSEEMKNDEVFSGLYDLRNSFCNYKIARSYLGLAKRDLAHMNNNKDDRSRNKKLAHAHRGYLFAMMVQSSTEFNPVLDKNSLQEINEIFQIKHREEREGMRDHVKDNVATLTQILNKNKDKGELLIPKNMKPEDQLMLDNFVVELKGSEFYKSRVQEDLLFYSVYEANEKDINY